MNPADTLPKSVKTPPRARRRPWVPWLGAAALAAVILAGFWPRPVPVETSRITAGELRSTVDEEGKTRIRQRYVVSAPVAGQLRRITFKAGAEVTSAQAVVAVIDPATPALLDARARSLAEARRDAAAAQLERARAARRFAASELQRNARLFQDRTVSPQELEGAQWRDTAAARDLTAAEAALRQAEAELQESPADGPATNAPGPVEVRAPAPGRVLKVYEESARTVATGTPLMALGDPADLEVVIEVLSRDGARIEAGAPVELEQWGGPAPLLGTVRYVEPAAFTKTSALGVDEQRVNVVADLTTPPAARGNLGDGFRVEARIVTWRAAHALKAPSGAVFRHRGQWSAYVVEGGRARLRPVRVGHDGGPEVEVLEGLREGDEVVLYPGDRVRDGQRVAVVAL